jgi:DNA-binding HxlR family transcriptional regulator
MSCAKNYSGKKSCQEFLLPLNDLMGVLNGKWKISLLICISTGPKRFNELKICHQISPRVLSKELKDLILHNVVSRKENDDNLGSVDYQLTEQGEALIPIIKQLHTWAVKYRGLALSGINKRS